MHTLTHPDADALGRAAAAEGALALREAVAARGEAVCVLATGASQFATLKSLLAEPVPWGRVTLLHLDEYLGLGADHPASFVKYLRDRFVGRLPVPPRAFHAIDGLAEPAGEVARLGALARPADVAFVGVGENGHLAFNDPPADFAAAGAYAAVGLDDACRNQQLGEGWFPDLDAVPARAISMTVPQILRSKLIVCSVPDARKAAAVAASVRGPVTPLVPASVLQTHPACRLHLDAASAAGLA